MKIENILEVTYAFPTAHGKCDECDTEFRFSDSERGARLNRDYDVVCPECGALLNRDYAVKTLSKVKQ